jgi:hypothetical protein
MKAADRSCPPPRGSAVMFGGGDSGAKPMVMIRAWGAAAARVRAPGSGVSRRRKASSGESCAGSSNSRFSKRIPCWAAKAPASSLAAAARAGSDCGGATKRTSGADVDAVTSATGVVSTTMVGCGDTRAAQADKPRAITKSKERGGKSLGEGLIVKVVVVFVARCVVKVFARSTQTTLIYT